MTVFLSFFRSASRLVSDTRGVTAAIVALGMATLVGFAGLGVETGLWFSKKRTYQTAADAGALAGAWQMANQLTASNGLTFSLDTSSTGHATQEAVRNGAPSTSDVAITQLSGPAAQAVVTVPTGTLFANLFFSSLSIKARAVASIKSSKGCDVALFSGTGHPGVTLQGSGTLNLVNCQLMSDATGCDASGGGGNNTSSIVIADTGFHLSGATDLEAAGCIDQSASFSCGTTGAVCNPGAANMPDPFASTFKNFSMPATPCSSSTSFVANTFHYGKINMSTGTVNLTPGTYYIDSGCGSGADGSITMGSSATLGCTACSLTPNAQGVLDGQGVTLIANGPISIKSANSLNAPGPGSGQPYPGVLIYQPANWQTAPTNGSSFPNNNCDSHFVGLCDTVTGNANQTLTGAIYMPAGWLTFTGDESTSGCLEIVTFLLTLTGNSGMNTTNCGGFAPTPTHYYAVLTQ